MAVRCMCISCIAHVGKESKICLFVSQQIVSEQKAVSNLYAIHRTLNTLIRFHLTRMLEIF